jgi:hypothetical protein
LGLASPVLGPWFSDPSPTLSAPSGDLSVGFSPTAAIDWLPPARGILSLLFATPTRPAGLAPLRAATGNPAFTNNRLVALFRLLPEVEARLDSLAVGLPSPDGGASTGPTRPTPRWFAIESTTTTTGSNIASVVALWSNGFATDDNTDPKKLASLGLKGIDGALANAEKPASVLLGPGGAFGASDKLLRLDTTAYTLWAFDSRGRAIDPGAVASWWAFLATSLFDNLWASGVTQRTCAVAAARSLHLVNAHEGALTAAMLGRANVGNASGAATDVVRQASGTTAVTIAFTAAPAIDHAPVPRAALLPHRAYATSVNLWPSGPVVTGLERDYARVALIDVEGHLTGQPRSPAAVTPSSGEARRAADQNRGVDADQRRPRAARRFGSAAAAREPRRRRRRADLVAAGAGARHLRYPAARSRLWSSAAACG